MGEAIYLQHAAEYMTKAEEQLDLQHQPGPITLTQMEMHATTALAYATLAVAAATIHAGGDQRHAV